MPLGHFALEVLIDKIVDYLGFGPLEYRLEFHVTSDGPPRVRTTPADELLLDQLGEESVPFSSNGLRDCLLEGGSTDRLAPAPLTQRERN